jgi:hypothetical protein
MAGHGTPARAQFSVFKGIRKRKSAAIEVAFSNSSRGLNA